MTLVHNLVSRHWPTVTMIHAADTAGPRFTACGLPNPRLFVRRVLARTDRPVSCPDCIVAVARVTGSRTTQASPPADTALPGPVHPCCGAPVRTGWDLHTSWCQVAADARWATVHPDPDLPVLPDQVPVERRAVAGTPSPPAGVPALSPLAVHVGETVVTAADIARAWGGEAS
ncbi:MAG: hypothetical protein M3Y91_06760 [Actinomycetota bacterium]|nr:hypothetical protein [Actinomycetota bacterium]